MTTSALTHWMNIMETVNKIITELEAMADDMNEKIHAIHMVDGYSFEEREKTGEMWRKMACIDNAVACLRRLEQ